MVSTLACTIVSDPLSKMLGLHQRRLSVLLDNIERELMIFSQKRIASHGCLVFSATRLM